MLEVAGLPVNDQRRKLADSTNPGKVVWAVNIYCFCFCDSLLSFFLGSPSQFPKASLFCRIVLEITLAGMSTDCIRVALFLVTEFVFLLAMLFCSKVTISSASIESAALYISSHRFHFLSAFSPLMHDHCCFAGDLINEALLGLAILCCFCSFVCLVAFVSCSTLLLFSKFVTAILLLSMSAIISTWHQSGLDFYILQQSAPSSSVLLRFSILQFLTEECTGGTTL